MSAVEQNLPGARLGTAGNKVFSRLDAAAHLDHLTRKRRVLYHHHRVGPFGQGRTGHDSDGLSRADSASLRFCGSARLNLANHFQLRRDVGYVCGPHRISIARRPSKRREVAVGHERFRQHSARRRQKIHGFDRACRHASRMPLNDVPGIFEALHR